MTVSAREFRRTLGHFASGVPIITTLGPEGNPTGLTATAFTSVSLDPPMVLVCVDRSARCYRLFVGSGRFAVNILKEDQSHISQQFASSVQDKFREVQYRAGSSGLPVLTDALAHLECTITQAYPGGDHTIFVGKVDAAAVQPGTPLLYYRGTYCRLVQPDGLLPPRNSRRDQQEESMVQKQRMSHPQVFQPASPYSVGIKARGNTVLYLAGQVALDSKGGLVGKGDVEAQTRQVFTNLINLLASEGASLKNVVKTTAFLTDLAHFPKFAEVRKEYLKEDDVYPASTLVVAKSLAHPDWLVEIEATAVID